VLDRHAGPPDFYLSVLLWALPSPLLPALAGLLLLPPGITRRLAGFAVCQLLGVMLVYSSAATKIYWYVAPAVPFYAIAAAIAGLAVIRAATEARVRLPARPLQFGAAALLLFATGSAIVQRYLRPLTVLLPAPAAAPLLAAAVQQRPGAAVTIVDDGVFNDAGFAHYVPTWRFHALAAGRAGRRVAIVPSLAAAGAAPLIGSCDARWRASMAAAGTILWQGRGCLLVERPQPQPKP